jgi:DNA-binding transcriptional LysR family regulator
LGARLVERTHTGTRLTDAGKAFLPFAERLLAAARDGVEAVRDLDREARGDVTLAVAMPLVTARLTGELQAFRAVHPGVRVVLRTADNDGVSTLVRQGEAHFGVRFFADPHAALEGQTVLEERLVVVAAARSRLAPLDARVPADLAGAPWTALAPAGGTDTAFLRLLERQLARCQIDGAEIIAIDSVAAQKRLIEADFALGLLPESAVAEELQLGTLRRLPLPALEATAPVVLMRRRGGYLARAARALLGFVLGAAGEA